MPQGRSLHGKQVKAKRGLQDVVRDAGVQGGVCGRGRGCGAVVGGRWVVGGAFRSLQAAQVPHRAFLLLEIFEKQSGSQLSVFIIY